MIFRVFAVLCCSFVASYAAIAPGQNAYLPPKTPGYQYPKPTVPFPTQPPQTYRPPPTARPTPSYRPPTSRPTPSYRPPTIPATRPPTGPTYVGQPASPGSTYVEQEHHHVHKPGMPFDFNYAVKDDQYGNDYSHNAVSDGDVTRGEYRIQLPDGRTQIVKYTADWKTGFHAQVKFEGTPNYQARPSIPRPTQTQFPSQPPPSFPSGPPRPVQPSFPTGPARPFQPGFPAPSGPSRPTQPGYPSGPKPIPSFPSPKPKPSRPNQIPGQQYGQNGGYKY